MGEEHETFGKDVPAPEIGHDQNVGISCHGAFDALVVGRRLVDGIVQSERTVNEIPVRETLPHRGGVYGASDLGVYDLHGGEHRDLRLLDTERVRERCGVFRDLDLRFQIRINVYGAVRDDEEPILLGDLENGRLAEQIAIFLQALLLVQNGLHEGRGVH